MRRSKWLWALVAAAVFVGSCVIAALLVGPDENAPRTTTRDVFIAVFFLIAMAAFVASLALVIFAVIDRPDQERSAGPKTPCRSGPGVVSGIRHKQ
jgi:hypothetical protein